MAEAKILKARYESQIATGEYVAPTKTTFADYADGWLKGYQGRDRGGVAESTVLNYQMRLDCWLVPYFGRMRLRSIKPADVRAFVAHLEASKTRNGRAPSSNYVRAVVGCLKAIFSTALEDSLIQTNPATAVKLNRRVSLRKRKRAR